ncbi:MAG: hypothetical protein ACFFAN_06885 [Promethearchaeota archaeon]
MCGESRTHGSDEQGEVDLPLILEKKVFKNLKEKRKSDISLVKNL